MHFPVIERDPHTRGSTAANIGMEHIESDIDLQIDNPAKSAANLIEWNVDMKVTVSNVQKSKMFQRSRTIVLFLLVIVFAVFLSHLRKEVRALQMQVESVNVNLLLLMSKYDRLNRSLNRAWIQRSEMLLGKRNLYDVKELVARKSSISKAIEIFGGIPNATNGSSRAYNFIVPRVNYVKNRKYLLHNDPYSKIDRKSLMQLENNDVANDTNVRFERAILALEKPNVTERNVRSNRDNDAGLQLDIWREPRSRRLRRDEGRGKKRGKNKRRPKRSRRRLEPLVATFVGAIPEQHVTDTVYIGPWVKSTRNNTQYSLNKFHLVEDKKSIEVTVTGLYMISAQIFYFGEPTNYSYWILLSSEGKSATQKLVKCSTASSTTATEVSCYTSVITPLQRGDRVRIQQQERDRFINMREGHSYIQLVLLSNSICKKRLR